MICNNCNQNRLNLIEGVCIICIRSLNEEETDNRRILNVLNIEPKGREIFFNKRQTEFEE